MVTVTYAFVCLDSGGIRASHLHASDDYALCCKCLSCGVTWRYSAELIGRRTGNFRVYLILFMSKLFWEI